MTDELIPAEGISRRDMLKRSAVVGGASAMVWAAPSITTLGARAFGTEGTLIQGFSYAAAVVVCNGKSYRVKYEKDEFGFEEAPGSLPDCEDTAFAQNTWKYAETVSPDNPGTNPGVWTMVGTGEDSFKIRVYQKGMTLYFELYDTTCVFSNGMEGGVAKDGKLCNTAVSGGGTQLLAFDLTKFGVEETVAPSA